MSLDASRWYVRLAYWGETVPDRTSLCALFWRVLGAGLFAFLAPLAFVMVIVVFASVSPVLSVILGVGVGGLLFLPDRFKIYGAAVIAGVLVSFFAFLVADVGWLAAIRAIVLVLGTAVASLAVILGLLLGCILVSDRIAGSDSMVAVRLRAWKSRVCPWVEIREVPE